METGTEAFTEIGGGRDEYRGASCHQSITEPAYYCRPRNRGSTASRNASPIRL